MGKSKKREGIERCKCCLEDSDLKKLWSSNDGEGDCQTYGEMLTDCFALTWKQPSNINSEHICENCVKRLQDAINFKKEILFSEQRLLEKIKDEPVSYFKQETEFDDEITTAYLTAEYEEENADDEETNIKAEPATKPETISKKKNNSYTDEDVQKSVDAVIKNKISQSKAAVMFNVPRSAISRALARRKPTNACKETREKPMNFIKTRRKERPILDSYLFPELKNFDSDVCVIFDCSNASPIRCRGGVGYKCCFCPQQFPDPADLKKHTTDKHDSKTITTLIRGRHGSSFLLKLDISYLQCNLCNKKMETLETLINHLINDHGKNIHKNIKNFVLPFKFEGEEIRCVICNSLFNKFKVLQEHMSTHFRNYICDYCSAGFVTRSILLNHMKCHLTGLFKCDFCSKTYDTVRKKRAHEIQVHIQGRMLYKCGYCSEKFNRYQKREEHLVKVHGVQSVTFKCQACDKVLVSQQALRDHTRRDHLMERQHTCPECGLNFFRPSDVRRHMVRHTGVRKFQCDVCLKAYSRLNTLREHLRIHADDRRFKCGHCGLGFVQKCSWRAHMRTKHGEQV